MVDSLGRKYRNKDWLRKKYLEENLSTTEIGEICDVHNSTIGNWLDRFGIETGHGEGKYTDEEWLREKYWGEELSMRQIADLCNCSSTMPIRYYMKKYGIKKRAIAGANKDAKYRNKEWLKEKYIDEELSSYEIAEICECNRRNVNRWIVKHDISVRKGGHKLKHFDLDEGKISFLEGQLLGDGSIVYTNTNREGEGTTRSARYKHGDKHSKYIDWLADKLQDFGIKGVKETRNDVSFFKSYSYAELSELRQRWYPDGEKKIPEEFQLDPTKLMFWYIGDGTFNQSSKNTNKAVIYCYNLREGMEKIISPQLSSIGIKHSVYENSIYIHQKTRSDFFDYILQSPYRPPCYSYKFPEEYQEEFPD